MFLSVLPKTTPYQSCQDWHCIPSHPICQLCLSLLLSPAHPYQSSPSHLLFRLLQRKSPTACNVVLILEGPCPEPWRKECCIVKPRRFWTHIPARFLTVFVSISSYSLCPITFPHWHQYFSPIYPKKSLQNLQRIGLGELIGRTHGGLQDAQEFI